MRRTRTAVIPLCLIAAAALFTAGCSESSPAEPEGITIADLVGSWKASSVLFTNQANPSQQFELVSNGGELRTTVLQHGGARTWLDIGTVSDEWDAQLTLVGNQLTSTPVEASRPTRHYTVELAGNQLTLTSSDGSFDFTLSGAPALPATEKIVFQRH